MFTRFFAAGLVMLTLTGVSLVYTVQAYAGETQTPVLKTVSQIIAVFSAPDKAGPKADLRQFLPPAQEGWKRFEWNDFAEKHLNKTDIRDEVIGHFPELENYLKLDQAMGRERRKSGTWVYAGNGKLLSIRVTQSHMEGRSGGQHNQQELTDRNATQLPRYALIRGVRFFEVPDEPWNGKSAKYRYFKARLGAGVTIYVRAIADDGTIKSYLRAIDYEGIIAASPDTPPDPARSPFVYRLIGDAQPAQKKPETDKPQVRINRGLRTDCKSIGNPRHCRPMAVQRAD
jgi:hypothetical protein